MNTNRKFIVCCLLTFFSITTQAQDHFHHKDHLKKSTDHSIHNSKSYKTDHSEHPGHASHDPFIFYFNMEELQSSLSQDEPIYKSKLHLWMGKDQYKLGFRSQIENSDKISEYIEKEILFSSALSVYWNWQIGVRQDRNPIANTEWISVGLEGEAPYFIHSQLNFIANQDGNTGLRLHFQQNWRINNSWKLQPETELNFYSEGNTEFSRQSGLNDLHINLKLLYDKNRKLAPYLAIEYEKKWGNESDVQHEDSSQISAGLSFWF